MAMGNWGDCKGTDREGERGGEGERGWERESERGGERVGEG